MFEKMECSMCGLISCDEDDFTTCLYGGIDDNEIVCENCYDKMDEEGII